MNEKAVRYFFQILEGRKKGLWPQILLFLLHILSLPYGFVVISRRFLYSLGILPRKRAEVPVISVGNITVGGTGKTPLVRYLTQFYREQGFSPAILLRGYGGAFQGEAGLVTDGHTLHMEAKQAGEEAVMMAWQMPGVPILIGKKRIACAHMAAEKLDIDLLILDDGFQHLQIRRQLDLVAVDATNPFGYGYLLPRGLLREPLRTLKSAQILVLTKVDQVPARRLQRIKDNLKQKAPGSLLVEAGYRAVFLRDLPGEKTLPLDLHRERILAFSGIGNPRSFEETIKGLGGEITARLRFPDHHSYTEEEILHIFSLAFQRRVDLIITTEKDAIGLPLYLRELIAGQEMTLWVLGIEIEVLDKEERLHEYLTTLPVEGGKRK